MSSKDVHTLMEMGFPENRAEKALFKTNYKGIQDAMEWLFAHADDPDIDDPFEAPKGNVLGSNPTETTSDLSPNISNSDSVNTATPMEEASQDKQTESKPDTVAQEAKSYKCDECGKLLKDADALQFHAAKTGHSAFSESSEEVKPLTAEEKKAQLDKLQGMLKQRRLEKEQEERKAELDREKSRRVMGKELVSAKTKLQEEEMRRIAEQKRREKMEEKLAKQKVREQIEKDKRDRALKFGKKSSEPAPAAAPTAVSSQVAPSGGAQTKEYNNCRLQIRLTDGKAINQTFNAKEQLAAVRLFVELNRTDGSSEPFTFMTTFPRKVFSLDDMERPLSDLGLAPSAVLILTKPQ